MSNSNLEMVKRLMSNPKWEKFAASVSEERPADVKDGKSKEDLLKELCQAYDKMVQSGSKSVEELERRVAQLQEQLRCQIEKAKLKESIFIELKDEEQQVDEDEIILNRPPPAAVLPASVPVREIVPPSRMFEIQFGMKERQPSAVRMALAAELKKLDSKLSQAVDTINQLSIDVKRSKEEEAKATQSAEAAQKLVVTGRKKAQQKEQSLSRELQKMSLENARLQAQRLQVAAQLQARTEELETLRKEQISISPKQMKRVSSLEQLQQALNTSNSASIQIVQQESGKLLEELTSLTASIKQLETDKQLNEQDIRKLQLQIKKSLTEQAEKESIEKQQRSEELKKVEHEKQASRSKHQNEIKELRQQFEEEKFQIQSVHRRQLDQLMQRMRSLEAEKLRETQDLQQQLSRVSMSSNNNLPNINQDLLKVFEHQKQRIAERPSEKLDYGRITQKLYDKVQKLYKQFTAELPQRTQQ